MEHFVDNISRLAGMHLLTQSEVAEMVQMSRTTFSKWNAGERSPSFETALALSGLFLVDAGRLARVPFRELVGAEVGSQERFDTCEAEIEKRRHHSGRPIGKVTRIGRGRRTPKGEQ